MANANSLTGLMKWLRRDEWRDALNELLDRHLGPACAKAGVSFDALPGVIGDHHSTVLWGCAFEDLLARDLGDGRNIVDDYLKRRGWKESASNKAYITALRSSVMSLYENQRHRTGGVVPGTRSGTRRRTGTGERAIGDAVSEALGSDGGASCANRFSDGDGRRCHAVRL